MIITKHLWAGFILLFAIPLFLMDVPEHYIEWKSKVRDETYFITQNAASYTPEQKDEIVNRIFKANKNLMEMIFSKSIAGIFLFCLSIYLLLGYIKYRKQAVWKVFFICTTLVFCNPCVKYYLMTKFAGDQKIKLITLSSSDSTLTNIYNSNFKGKLLYVDLWGTNCGPCLEEFMNFTKPLKDRYRDRTDIAYLYVGSGHLVIWKQLLQKFAVEGSHVRLDADRFKNFYEQAISGSKDTREIIPRYLIINKHGKIVETNAHLPSEKDALYKQLDTYLATD